PRRRDGSGCRGVRAGGEARRRSRSRRCRRPPRRPAEGFAGREVRRCRARRRAADRHRGPGRRRRPGRALGPPHRRAGSRLGGGRGRCADGGLTGRHRLFAARSPRRAAAVESGGMTDSAAVPPEATDDIRALIADAGLSDNIDLIARMLATGVGLGLDDTDCIELKIASAALTEMRAAFRLFDPHRDAPKVTIFGSARTMSHDVLYRAAADVAAALAERGWMVVTGAG